MYSETTNFIKVSVQPEYVEDQSAPENNHYVWAYHVLIENRSANTVQLLSRHWLITDAMGQVQEVRGEGVVGEQPLLEPGEAYEYSSGTPLSTPSGIMMGSYTMINKTGERFDIAIPAFSLDSAFGAKSLN